MIQTSNSALLYHIILNVCERRRKGFLHGIVFIIGSQLHAPVQIVLMSKVFLL